MIDHFRDFLEREVNLDETRLGRLNSSVEAVTTFLEGSQTFGSHFLGVIPQGSYAHKTIIKPVRKGDEFDADVLLHLEEFEGWAPTDYVENLYSCFRASGVYKEKVGRRTRCVTLNYAGDFHIDVVPYLERHGNKYITNRKENQFELTDPEAYNAWLDDRNRASNRHLVRVIRLVKYLRDYKGTFDVKSVILNVLLGERVSDASLLSDPGCYSDVPTTLRTVMNRLAEFVSERRELPSIIDPSGTGENFSDRWDQDGYASFRAAVIRYAGWINEAWTEPDEAASLKKWQRVFGDGFKAPQPAREASALVVAGSPVPTPFRKSEQRLSDLGIRTALQPGCRFRITGRVLRKGSMGAYYLKDRGNKVLRHRQIQFSVSECGVPEPYRLYWKVLNRGHEAQARDMVRGQIEEGHRTWRITETTDFLGSHFVECYAVRNGVCVARDRQEVLII